MAVSKLDEEILKRLKLARTTLGLSQEEMATKLGLTRPNYSTKEQVRSTLTAEQAATLCLVCGINGHWLLLGEGKMMISDPAEPSILERLIEVERKLKQLIENSNN
jgi:transcriptional regulator with XRE-family HTH domain